MENSGEAIMAALISLHPRRFSDITHSLSCDLRLQHRRLCLLLLSPHHFSQTLSHLQSLSLHQKTTLLARFLLRSLSKLLPSSSHHHHHHHHCPSNLRLRDYDAALLLSTMCEVYDCNESCVDWHMKIANHLMARTLSPSGLGAHGWGIVSRYVDTAAKCRRLLEVVSGNRLGGAHEEKLGLDVGASIAAVVLLPSVECRRAGKECVVCKEEIEVGRDVCALPCEHEFHWGCILPWLRKRNTCPCCRFELPTDDVFCEIERVWRSAVRMGRCEAEIQ